jgi:hypothetical protein
MSLKIEYATVANCSPDHIWRVFEDVSLWPRWDPEALRSVAWVQGTPWVAGSKLELALTKPMEVTITAELVEASAPIAFHLKGAKSGITADMWFIFTPRSDGKTEMRTMQEYSGAALMFFGDRARGPLELGVAHMFGRIQAEAEYAAQAEVPVQYIAKEPAAQPAPEQPIQLPPSGLEREEVRQSAARELNSQGSDVEPV